MKTPKSNSTKKGAETKVIATEGKVMVTLIHDKIEEGRTFEKSHAERILKMRNNGGWKLPENSDFKLGENGIDANPITGTAKSASE